MLAGDIITQHTNVNVSQYLCTHQHLVQSRMYQHILDLKIPQVKIDSYINFRGVQN